MPFAVPSIDRVTEVVKEATCKFGTNRDELIPILNYVNKSLGYIPSEALTIISDELNEPESNLLGVASFYRMLSTKPRGTHVIQFCENAPCHVVGGRAVLKELKEYLNISTDQTTADGKWTLITTSCLGLCGVGPVIVIDDDVYGNVEPGKIAEIIGRYEEVPA
ncbi:MAG TPA: NAD(P)H-dependent oxidoreductase subunit E [Bellilinea sp.]|nr:NAD(P)H-dependent oxidoreductase subunit E [Bellilinea sp.]